MDTVYVLIQHQQPGQGRWTPVFQRTDAHDNQQQLYYFPIGLSDQQFTCVLCPVRQGSNLLWYLDRAPFILCLIECIA